MTETAKFSSLQPEQFAALALNSVAYVKPVEQDGQAAFGIFRADGNQAAVVMSHDQALALIIANELQPVSLH